MRFDAASPTAKIFRCHIYGIMGSYGITAFVGDTLSYCRLLALGLTTSIVAMSFNLMAGMLREVPYVGFILFLMVLIVGHLFNFCISVLGAFVHSMRLIFVEFFGRFYEVGSRPFQPLGFDSPACIVKRSGEPSFFKGKYGPDQDGRLQIRSLLQETMEEEK